MNVNNIANRIIAAATQSGEDTWDKIRHSAPIYIKGYARSLVDIAAGVADGEISPSDAAMYAQTSRLMLVQSIANTAHILFAEVQEFIDSVIDIVRGAVSEALGFSI